MDLQIAAPALGDSALSLALLILFLYIAKLAPCLRGISCWAWAQCAAMAGASLMDMSANAHMNSSSPIAVYLLLHLGAVLGVLGTMACAIAISMFVRQGAMRKAERLASILIVAVLTGTLLWLDSKRNDWTMYLCVQLLCLGAMPLGLLSLRRAPYRTPALMMSLSCALLFGLYACELTYTLSSQPETWAASTLTLLERDVNFWFLLNFCMLLLVSFKALSMQQQLAEHDPLTGALNRRGIDRRMNGAREMQASNPLCVLLLDLDHFKRVNDEHGHDVGDLVLQGTADAVRSCLRERDLFVRLGGEEFAVLSEVPAETAVAMAERIRAHIASRPLAGQLGLHVTASIGVAVGQHGVDYHELIKLADQAVYRAKHAGRDRVELLHWASSSSKDPAPSSSEPPLWRSRPSCA